MTDNNYWRAAGLHPPMESCACDSWSEHQGAIYAEELAAKVGKKSEEPIEKCVVARCISPTEDVRLCYWSGPGYRFPIDTKTHAYLVLCKFHSELIRNWAPVETCSVVTSMENLGSWYPVCGRETSGKRLPVLDLAVCDFHADCFGMKPRSVEVEVD